MLSIRAQGRHGRLSNDVSAQELFWLLGTITSRELEFIIVEASRGLSLIRPSAWGQFFKAFAALQASCRKLSIFVGPYERFMAENFVKGEILVHFLGFERELDT
jgi:hypothetical protein